MQEALVQPTTTDNETRVFPCEQCGADLKIKIGAPKLACEYCGFEKALSIAEDAKISENDLMATLERLKKRERSASSGLAAQTQEMQCTSCAATIVYHGTLTSQACAYCGAPDQKPKGHSDDNRLAVDAVITFLIASGDATNNVRQWIQSRWFAPNGFKNAVQMGRLNGVYVPYFTFDAMTNTAYRGQRGDYYTVTEGSGNNQRTVTKTRWTPASGRFQRFFDDVLIPAITTLPRELLASLNPWPMDKSLPFTPEALSGKLSHTYDMELEQCFPEAKAYIEKEIVSEVHERIGGNLQRIESLHTAFSTLSYKHVLLPVWLLAYRYGDKSFRVAINAATGKVHGERPWSVIKIILATLCALAALGTALYIAAQS